MELANKVVVITGSGGGTGEAFARRFAAEGAKIVVTDIDSEGVRRVSEAIGSVDFAGDITTQDTVRAVAELARSTYARSTFGSATPAISERPRPVTSSTTRCGTSVGGYM
ncbi:UNVERIFIED_CONTAM: short subunit dehydrogenase [Williamsia faeni]